MILPGAQVTKWKVRIQDRRLTGKNNHLEETISFLADVHLGKLARSLRMLGIDTSYRNDFTNKDLISIAEVEKRILLSRNGGFAKHSSLQFLFIESEDPVLQLKQVTKRFGLEKFFKPFSRCMVCNGILEKKNKAQLEAHLEENTKKFYDVFWQCNTCHKIYWKGPHYERMLPLLTQLDLHYNIHTLIK
jgi:uncharacterized protein with PIN domain